MRAFRISPRKTEGKSIRSAVDVLRGGGIVAFPTETVYGLCVDPSNEEAVRRLYAVKGRDADKGCAYLLGEAEDVERLTPCWPRPAQRLARQFWPGPLTLVVPDGSGGRVGLRFPAVPVARALARQFGGPLLQTSANLSGQPAALNAAGILRALPGGVDLLLDAGKAPGGVSSTAVACEGVTFEVLREGAIPIAEIESVAVERIVVVCTGNICRSPTGAFMLRDIAAQRLECPAEDLARHAFKFSSCGTHGWHAAPATPEAQKAAKQLGYDLSAHTSRPLDLAILGTADRVWCMDAEHRAELGSYFQDRPEALRMFDPAGEDVADPYGRSMRFYRKTARRIEELARLRVEELLGDGSEGAAG